MKLRVILVIFMLYLASGAVSQAGPKGENLRKANKYEVAYKYIAVDGDHYELCSKISPKAKGYPSKWIKQDESHDTLRSQCFYNTAVNTLNLKLCSEVKPFTRPYKGEPKISSRDCQSRVRSRLKALERNRSFKQIRISEDYPSKGIGWLMQEMGYTYKDIEKQSQDYNVSKEEDVWLNFYLDIKKERKFKQRLKKLPDFSHE